MTTNRFTATFAVAVFLVGVPVATALRLADGALPFRAIDLMLVVGIVGWFHFAKAIFDRDDPVDSTRVHRTSLRWQAHALVEASLFGAAASVAAPPSSLVTGRLQPASDDIAALLPPPELAPVPTQGLVADDDDRRSATQPILHAEASDDLPAILATETYVVARGDTYWSIAEVTLGEGRFWTAIRDLNMGREVAPGIELGLDQDLRIGWTVLIPLVAGENQAAVHG